MSQPSNLRLAFAHYGLPDRIWDKIQVSPTGCWLWTASLSGPGYGKSQFVIDGKCTTRTMHRVMYEAANGPLIDGLVVDHLCEVRRCCNPAHLEQVTGLENTRRWVANHVTHCKRGHEYVAGSFYVVHNGKGFFKRDCKICRSDSSKRYRARKRAA